MTQQFKNLSLKEIEKCLTEQQLQILDLYLKRVKQKDIINQTKCTRSNIDTLVAKYNLSRFRTRNNYTINTKVLNKYNPSIWYFLGWFASDGNLHTTNSGTNIIQFTLKDFEPLEQLKSLLEYSGEIKTYNKFVKSKESFNSYYYLGISNNSLINFISEIFNRDMHRKTHDLEFPEIPNESCVRMFIRGFWDGDGCFTLNSANNCKAAKIHCSSLTFCEGLQNFLNTIGIHSLISTKNTCPELSIYRKDSFKNFVDWLYTEYPEFGLTRKKEKALNLVKLL